jgi:hypothetical protein
LAHSILLISGYLSGPAAIANAIRDMGALLSLDISSNRLLAEGTTPLAQALKDNQIMTALNISSNFMTYDGEKPGDMSGAAVLTDVIPGMGALLQLHVAQNNFGVEGTRFFCDNLSFSARCVAEWFVNTKYRYIWSIKWFLWLVQWLLPQSHCDLLLPVFFLQIV